MPCSLMPPISYHLLIIQKQFEEEFCKNRQKRSSGKNEGNMKHFAFVFLYDFTCASSDRLRRYINKYFFLERRFSLREDIALSDISGYQVRQGTMGRKGSWNLAFKMVEWVLSIMVIRYFWKNKMLPRHQIIEGIISSYDKSELGLPGYLLSRKEAGAEKTETHRSIGGYIFLSSKYREADSKCLIICLLKLCP